MLNVELCVLPLSIFIWSISYVCWSRCPRVYWMQAVIAMVTMVKIFSRWHLDLAMSRILHSYRSCSQRSCRHEGSTGCGISTSSGAPNGVHTVRTRRTIDILYFFLFLSIIHAGGYEWVRIIVWPRHQMNHQSVKMGVVEPVWWSKVSRKLDGEYHVLSIDVRYASISLENCHKVPLSFLYLCSNSFLGFFLSSRVYCISQNTHSIVYPYHHLIHLPITEHFTSWYVSTVLFINLCSTFSSCHNISPL
jgi:hypothetical protein